MRVVIALLLAACTGCFPNTYHLYGTDFDERDGRTLVVWQDEDLFRFVERISDASVSKEAEIFEWPLRRPLPDALLSHTHALVLVNVEWERAVALAGLVRAESPQVDVHLVRDEAPWSDYRTTGDVSARLIDLRYEARIRRPDEGGLFVAVAMAFELLLSSAALMMTPDIVVIPVPDRPGYFACVSRPGGHESFRVISVDEVIVWLRSLQGETSWDGSSIYYVGFGVGMIVPGETTRPDDALLVRLAREEHVTAFAVYSDRPYAELEDALRRTGPGADAMPWRRVCLRAPSSD